MKEQLKDWYTKPRKSDKFIRWIMFDPKALSVLMVMGHLVAFALFAALFVWSVISFGWFMKIFSFVLVALTVYNLIKYYRFQRKTGSIFDSASMNDMVYGGKKQ